MSKLPPDWQRAFDGLEREPHVAVAIAGHAGVDGLHPELLAHLGDEGVCVAARPEPERERVPEEDDPLPAARRVRLGAAQAEAVRGDAHVAPAHGGADVEVGLELVAGAAAGLEEREHVRLVVQGAEDALGEEQSGEQGADGEGDPVLHGRQPTGVTPAALRAQPAASPAGG